MAGRPKGSTNKKVTTTKKEEVETTSKKSKCMMCGSNLLSSNFYKSNARIYAGNNATMCYCKKCVTKEYLNFLSMTSGNEALSIKMTCCEFSIAFSQSFCDGAISEAKNRREKEATDNGEVYNPKKQIEDNYAFGSYMKNLNSLGKTNGVNDDGFDYISNLQMTDDENVSVDIFNEKARGLKVTNEMIEFWDNCCYNRPLCFVKSIANSFKCWKLLKLIKLQRNTFNMV